MSDDAVPLASPVYGARARAAKRARAISGSCSSADLTIHIDSAQSPIPNQSFGPIDFASGAVERQIKAMTDLLERVDRTLTGLPKLRLGAISMTESPPSMAIDDVVVIDAAVVARALVQINASEIPTPETVADTLVMLGLNYHEISHVMYTPQLEVSAQELLDALDPNRTELFDASSQVELQEHTHRRHMFYDLYNTMEDQRIEKIMVATFGRVAYYLTAAITKYFTRDNPSDLEYMLLAERRYIPVERRAWSRQLFLSGLQWGNTTEAEAEAKVQQWEDIIHRYCMVAANSTDSHTHAGKMLKTLVMEAMVFANENNTMPYPLCTDAGERDHKRDRRSKESKVDAPAPNLPSKAEEDAKDEEALAKAMGTKSKSKGKGEAKGKGGSTDEEKPGAAGESDSGGDSGAPKPTENKGSTAGGAGAGGGVGGRGAGSEDGKRVNAGMANESVRQSNLEALKDTGVQRDIKGMQKAVWRAAPLPPKCPKGSSKNPITEPMRRQHAVFTRALSQYQDAADPGWERGTASGRLNMNAVIRGDDYTSVFDSWQEDKSDALDIEAFILLDRSGSMYGSFDSVAQASWVVKSALESVRAKVTVLSFDTNSWTLSDSRKREDPANYHTWDTGGGTHITSALEVAAVNLMDSKQKHRMILILTDGVWMDKSLAESRILEINAAGVTTALAFLGNASHDKHNCKHYVNISRGLDLSIFAKDILLGMIEDGMNN